MANDAQRLPPDATAEQRSACAKARRALAAAAASARRARRLGCPAWTVDLPPAEPHLRASLDRALAQIPPRPGRVIDVHVAEWSDADREIFCTSAALLTSSCPQMLAELAVCIRQVVLLRGYGITGFSDFAVQGAVFVNAERLQVRDGLPGAVRLAENLVHEGTHTRCYSAGLERPFLHTDRVNALVATPLRADPRPLWGLFQQLVVLCRCAELYRCVGRRTAARARHDTLTTQARQALDTLRTHADQLTDHGRAILDEAATAIGAYPSAAR